MIPIHRLIWEISLSIFIRTMNSKGFVKTFLQNRLDLNLSQDSILRQPDAAGVQIACRRGTVWITLDNDPRDIVLEAGQHFAGAGHRHTVVMALAPSSITVSAPPVPARSPREHNRQRPGLVFEQVLA
jgi:hypothetical protein